MKVKDIQLLYESNLLSEAGKDFFIYLLKSYLLEDDIEESDFKHWGKE